MMKAWALVTIILLSAFLVLQANGAQAPPLGMQPAISVDFYYLPDRPEVGEVVYFRNNSTGPITGSRWDFGDGRNATYSGKMDAWHVYSKPGPYKVILSLEYLTGRARMPKTVIISSSSSNLTEPGTSVSPASEDYSGLQEYDTVVARAEMAVAAIAIVLVGLWIGIKLVRKRR